MGCDFLKFRSLFFPEVEILMQGTKLEGTLLGL